MRPRPEQDDRDVRVHEGSTTLPGDLSPQDFREALSNVATAVSVIATDGSGGIGGVTCSALCGASDVPPLLAFCIHRKSAANALIRANGVLCVNCLQADQQDLSQLFAGAGSVPMRERFAGERWGVLTTGAPYHRDALIAFDCALMEARDVGTHSLFIAKVLATAQSGQAAPLLHQRRAYATVRPIDGGRA
jgi:flavin reductase (NADH)/flavin reductase/chlorophenol-4-monooxygenase component 1